MSERNYYVFCDDNCRFEGMTKEQIIAAITEATGNVPTAANDAFISKLKEQNAGDAFAVWIGTQAQYNAITEPVPNCLYLITDETTLEDIDASLTEIGERVTTLEKATDELTTTELVKHTELNDGVTGTLWLRKVGKVVFCDINIKWTVTEERDDNGFMPIIADFPDGYTAKGNAECYGMVHVSEPTHVYPYVAVNHGIALVSVASGGMVISGFGGIAEGTELTFKGSVIYHI